MLRQTLITAIAFFVISIAQAGDTTKTVQKEVKASKVAQDFKITEDSVNVLKSQYKIGYGGISKALALSQRSGLTVNEILKMKTEEKMGWGQIAKKLNLKPGEDYKAADESDSAMEKQAKKQEAMEKKAEKMAEKAEKKAEKAEQKADHDKSGK